MKFMVLDLNDLTRSVPKMTVCSLLSIQ